MAATEIATATGETIEGMITVGMITGGATTTEGGTMTAATTGGGTDSDEGPPPGRPPAPCLLQGRCGERRRSVTRSCATSV